jgi:hypothetical protein
MLAAIAAPIWVPFASISLVLAIPAAGLLALATAGRRPAGDSRAAFYLLAWTLAVGFLIYCQFALPGLGAKEDAAPFVETVEREAEGRPVLFFGIEKEYGGAKYVYWSRGKNELVFAATVDEAGSLIASRKPALLIAPEEMKALLESLHGGTLRFLFEGNLGKQRCDVFRVGAW